MSLFRLATDVLWLLPLALQYAIAIVMYFRGLARRFPFFFSYSLLLPARDLMLLRLPYPGPVYSRVYWWGEAGAILLSFGIIVEIIWHLTKPYPVLRTVFKVLWDRRHPCDPGVSRGFIVEQRAQRRRLDSGTRDPDAALRSISASLRADRGNRPNVPPRVELARLFFGVSLSDSVSTPRWTWLCSNSGPIYMR